MSIPWSDIFDYDGLVEIIVMLVTMMLIFDWKCPKRRMIARAIACGAGFFLSNTVVIYLREVSGLLTEQIRFYLYAILVVGFGLLFALRSLKGYWQQRVVTVLFFKDCVLFVSVLYKTSGDLWTTLFGDNLFAGMVNYVLSVVMILLAAVLCRKLTYPIRVPISDRYWLIAAMTPVVLLVLWTQMDTYGTESLLWRTGVNTMMMLVTFFSYALFIRLAREMERQMDTEMTNQSLAFQIRQMDDAKVMLDQARIARHELKNNYFYLETLLEQGEYDRMRQVLENDIWPQLQRQELVSTGNTFVDMLLSQKVLEARQKEIPVVLDVQLPKELKIQPQMLCSLLFNLLDNAIEASQQVDAPDIFCSMRENRGYLRIEIRNRIEGSVLAHNAALATTKQDSENHGIGMKMIHQVVEHCDGNLDIREQDGYFVVLILLPER